ncbi:hypothetical protein PAPYR_13529 [Paratrimastix pyriformis]|uniref:Uncharacterized protein n=1 Tax=Paratrimastix pyriformis TaxID=342808 RepID=A0ABQ8U067_9EUKA|nr:hypothetical protein PAPYR_13529 [Paratrimastix pyriformis]
MEQAYRDAQQHPPSSAATETATAAAAAAASTDLRATVASLLEQNGLLHARLAEQEADEEELHARLAEVDEYQRYLQSLPVQRDGQPVTLDVSDRVAVLERSVATQRTELGRAKRLFTRDQHRLSGALRVKGAALQAAETQLRQGAALQAAETQLRQVR